MIFGNSFKKYETYTAIIARRGEGVGMSECHKKKTKSTWDFGPEGDFPKYCERCDRDLRFFSRPAGPQGLRRCRTCIPEAARSKIFQVRLPLQTLAVIKQKHGNVSAYLRGLILKDLGPEAMPEAALKRPNHGRLKVNTNL